MERKILLSLIVIVLMQSFVTIVQSSCSGEIDLEGVADWVEDGDTFVLSSKEWIRLADIDAPNFSEPGYFEAKSFLLLLIHNKTVHLDVDDVDGVFQRDKYGRLVCVVWIEYNSTHFMNVNKRLLHEDLAVALDFSNEFNPYLWSLYCPKETIPEFQLFLILPLFMMATLLIVTAYRKKYGF